MRTFGAALIIAGTTIGAGMLALPIQSRNMGLFPSIMLMTLIWGWMYVAAMQTVDLFLTTKKKVETLPDLCDIYLGKTGYALSMASLLCLFYSLLAAYTVGGSTLFNLIVPKFGYVFVIPLALVVFYCFEVADLTNRVLFALKVAVFFLIFITLFQHIHIKYIARYNFFVDYQNIIPVFFTAFGFHGSIPVMISYVGRDRQQLQKVIFWGSFIPLLVYIFWLAIGLGSTEYVPAELDGFITNLSHHSEHFKSLTSIFSLLAIATSYIGVLLSLFDILVKNIVKQKFIAFFCAFAPSFGLGFLYPKGFIMALTYAAGFLSVFGIILPSYIALKAKIGSRLFSTISFVLGLAITLLAIF